ncbi:MAG TPA: hypothetical protein VMB72_00095 [Acidimicrobiales bacterium]|nr:hypothetical protein [Acidimicrobiales bacterium]
MAAVLALATGTVGLAALIVAGSAPAGADPASTTAFVGVGADVTQDLWAAYTGASPAPGYSTAATTFYTPLHSSAATDNYTVASFDAQPFGGTTVAPGCITTKTGGPSFDRPSSTTAGVAALLDSVNNVGFENSSGSCTNATVSVTGQIDFARAARGPKGSGSTLTWIPYARDGLGVLYYDHGGTTISSLTTAELANLYSSSTGQATIDGVTVDACLPIAGSTPRSNLESAIGVSDATAQTAAAAAGCSALTQNSGNSFYGFASTLPSGTDAVVPISAGSWESQANGVAVDRSNTARANGVNLASITDGSTVLGLPYTGTAPNEAPNTTYYQSSKYGYNLYTVVPTSDVSGFFANAAIESLFVGSSSALCSTAAQTTAHTFGFDSLTSAEGTCGSTATQGNS